MVFLKRALFNQFLAISIALSSIIAGGIIYLTLRGTSLLIFDWLDFVGLSNFFQHSQNQFAAIKSICPEWVIYSLPDGLWVFSFTLFSLAYYKFNLNLGQLIFTFSIAGVGITLEFFQFINCNFGTFDIIDLSFYIAGSSLPFYIFKNEIKIHRSRGSV